MNINHPLPIVWDVVLSDQEEKKKNILLSLKVVELIFRRYKKAILTNGEGLISLNNFLNHLMERSSVSEQQNDTFLTEMVNKNEKKEKVILMKDEYKPRDLKYDKIKNLYEKELKGPTLKEMEANKRVLMVQKHWKQPDKEQQKTSQNEEVGVKVDENFTREKDPLAFFDPEFVKRLRQVCEKDMTAQTQKFSMDLDRHLNQNIGRPNRRSIEKTVIDKEMADDVRILNRSQQKRGQ